MLKVVKEEVESDEGEEIMVGGEGLRALLYFHKEFFSSEKEQ